MYKSPEKQMSLILTLHFQCKGSIGAEVTLQYLVWALFTGSFHDKTEKNHIDYITYYYKILFNLYNLSLFEVFVKLVDR